MEASSPVEIWEDQEMSRLDQDAAEQFFKVYRRSLNRVHFFSMILAMLMLGVLYLVDVPIGVAIFFGLFLFGILVMLNYMFRYALRDIRKDIENRRKRVVSGYLMQKSIYSQRDPEGDADMGKLPTLRKSGDGYWLIGGTKVHVSGELWKKAEVGEKVTVHILPKTNVAYKVETGFSTVPTSAY